MSKTTVFVHTPIQLEAKYLKQIREYLKNNYKLDAEIKVVIDNSVIAGVRLVYNDLVIDLSLKGKLNRLAEQIA